MKPTPVAAPAIINPQPQPQAPQLKPTIKAPVAQPQPIAQAVPQLKPIRSLRQRSLARSLSRRRRS
ncbi:hypothetical protein NB069_08910 [Leclercia adecarboxylata]|uniref:hypothetical protein n=1 Tax=Leclercia adecarboxylata TaxID=83655 RepID=UPI00202A0CD0|nr:hypothetical protein [Leclercia adecarboxylata]URO00968.1 hypothetical protein NB069_08910 [Leclercia adecarboxylata]